MRGPTLQEKRYGPGFRPVPVRRVHAPWPGCAAEVGDHPCADPPIGEAELWVDDTPPALDWYSKLLSKLPVQTWTWVKLCERHFTESVVKAEELVNPDTWAPWRTNPAVLVRPPLMYEPKVTGLEQI